ncbi:UDP-hexose transferase [Agaricicola taiwanensis]|uniref:UDP-hexose transferase n=1 Tax=Agaricicola taiwanensis TaxID=591372 RepID=A0A8J3DZS5_9RHOB|nr:UDP-hexose transferase [Agaricicola taiwanensis]
MSHAEAVARVLAAVDRVRIGGLDVAVLTRADTAELTVSLAMAQRGQGGSCLFFTTVNGQVISECADLNVRDLYRQADIISPDGMSTVWASKLLCPKALPERVATTDAFHDAALLAQERGASFYFLGATEEMNAKAVERAQQLYPGLRIAGRRNGYIKPNEEDAVVEEINAAEPDILWIGMGVPRQQRFVVRHRARLDKVGLVKTCGGLFDFLSGKNTRAPEWMQRNGLEWVYRMALEPRRLFWRYLVSNPHSIWLMATQSGAAETDASEGKASA